ncbi:MAG: DUF389 domain-containing protein [Synechococcaceae cyanobacterium SM2_3_2]|nr:DUF389 domain-containing protein [Synechococcaceae cyanobacterium SM2_3_2]
MVWRAVLSRAPLQSWRIPGSIHFPQVTLEEFQALYAGVYEESQTSLNYLMLVFTSCAIATFGLLSNSAAVIIGAMLVAPLMLPIRGLALGALNGDIGMFWMSLRSVGIGTGIGISLSCLIGLTVSLPAWGSEILARTQPNLLDLGVALAAGTVGAFAKMRPKISDSLAGVAISVALMPPVCVIGLGISAFDWPTSMGAALLYVTNLLGIALACMVTFLLGGYAPGHRARRVVVWTVGMTAALLIPLGASLTRLLTQGELEIAVRQALLNRAITFQRVELVESDFNWVANPPEVILTVRSTDEITPVQVGFMEALVEEVTGRPFTLIFRVTPIDEVRRPSPEPPPIPTQIEDVRPPLAIPQQLLEQLDQEDPFTGSGLATPTPSVEVDPPEPDPTGIPSSATGDPLVIQEQNLLSDLEPVDPLPTLPADLEDLSTTLPLAPPTELLEEFPPPPSEETTAALDPIETVSPTPSPEAVESSEDSPSLFSATTRLLQSLNRE